MVEMTKVGEETGNLDETLITVAENYEIEADRRTQTLLGMIEPVMTIAMGLGVGFLALSIFMPIYSSLSLVGGNVRRGTMSKLSGSVSRQVLDCSEMASKG